MITDTGGGTLACIVYILLVILNTFHVELLPSAFWNMSQKKFPTLGSSVQVAGPCGIGLEILSARHGTRVM